MVNNKQTYSKHYFDEIEEFYEGGRSLELQFVKEDLKTLMRIYYWKSIGGLNVHL